MDQLIESWLRQGQKMYAEVNNEYPVKEGVPRSKLVESWESSNRIRLLLNEVAAQRKTASELVHEIGFDEGPSS